MSDLVKVFADFPAVLGADVAFAGPDDARVEGRPQRINWRPVRSDYNPLKRASNFDRNPLNPVTNAWPEQAFMVCSVQVLVEVWGKNYKATQELKDRFLGVAYHLLSLHSFGVLSDEWNTGQTGEAGAVCSVLISVSVPVLKVQLPSRPITAVTATHQLGNGVVP
jgi:hypothetical protein